MDERAVLHRYKATRLAITAGLLVICGWFQYDLFVKKIIRWDFLIILTVMAVVKLAARFYLSRTN